jgi:uncharacterized protein (DUF3084 family)
MNLIELDNRLDKDIRLLEKNLNKHDKLLAEVKLIKNAYQSEIDKFMLEIERVQDETATALVAAEKLVKLQPKIDQYVYQADKMLQDRLATMENQNEEYLHNLESKIGNKIAELEETNKVELLRIINSLSEQEKEIISSRNELNGFITEEVKKLIEENMIIYKRLGSFDERLSEQQRESEAKLGNVHAWVEKEIGEWHQKNEDAHREMTDGFNKSLNEKYYLLENLNKSVTTKLNYFMVGTCILFLGLLVLFIVR